MSMLLFTVSSTVSLTATWYGSDWPHLLLIVWPSEVKFVLNKQQDHIIGWIFRVEGEYSQRLISMFKLDLEIS